MWITASDLRHLDPCKNGEAWLMENYPEGVEAIDAVQDVMFEEDKEAYPHIVWMFAHFLSDGESYQKVMIELLFVEYVNAGGHTGMISRVTDKIRKNQDVTKDVNMMEEAIKRRDLEKYYNMMSDLIDVGVALWSKNGFKGE